MAFLEIFLVRMAFHYDWIGLIMTCITTVRFNILYDGKEIGPIIHKEVSDMEILSHHIYL